MHELASISACSKFLTQGWGIQKSSRWGFSTLWRGGGGRKRVELRRRSCMTFGSKYPMAVSTLVSRFSLTCWHQQPFSLFWSFCFLSVTVDLPEPLLMGRRNNGWD